MPPTIVTLGLDAMRTRFELVLAGAPDCTLRDAGQAALAEIEHAEARLSLFRPDSLLSHINRTAHDAPVRLDADTLELLLTCREVWRMSDGAFDPTIAPRMTILGLHDGAVLPARVDTNARFDAVAVDERDATVRFTRAIALDLGAIAKGHALDLAGAILHEAGVTCALLHGGTSSVLAIGAPPGQDAWMIALRTPSGGMAAALGGHAADAAPDSMLSLSSGHTTPPTPVACTIALRDNALGVSAHRGRHAEHDSRVTHVLDPRTGRPATASHGLAAVVASSAALADAWSTACLVAGGRPAGAPPGLRLTLI